MEVLKQVHRALVTGIISSVQYFSAVLPLNNVGFDYIINTIYYIKIPFDYVYLLLMRKYLLYS